MILVTGGSGFVGPKVVHALRAQNHDVRCLVRSSRRASRLADWGCELVEGDMTDAASLRRAVTGCDTVVHLVAIIAGKPSDFARIMTKGTRDLVAAARDARVRRFVLMSALGTGEETKELTSYFAAKWAMEREVKGSGIEHVIFRPSFVFGRDLRRGSDESRRAAPPSRVRRRNLVWSPVTTLARVCLPRKGGGPT